MVQSPNPLMSDSAPLLVIGELMVDLISSEACEKLSEADVFQRFQGGSVANFALHLNRLGHTVRLIAAVGEDRLGEFLKDRVEKTTGSDYLQTVPGHNTSLFLGTRTSGTPDFLIYRGADARLQTPSKESLADIALYHTSAMSLSLEPARRAILEGAEYAHRNNVTISLDLNYSMQTWPNLIEAQNIILSLCKLNPLIKLSQDDGRRLFPGLDLDSILRELHQAGAKLICCTLGKDGSWVSFDRKIIRIPGKTLRVYDVTGAGDAYWAGFIHGWLSGKTLLECANHGALLAERKITTMPL